MPTRLVEQFARAFARAGWVETYAKKSAKGQKNFLFDEDKHPRGQPDNAGQFVEKKNAATPADSGLDSDSQPTKIEAAEKHPETKETPEDSRNAEPTTERATRGDAGPGGDNRDDGRGGDSGNAGQLQEGKDRIVTSRQALLPPVDRSVVPEGLQQHLDDHQHEGAARSISAMDRYGGFLLADGTGVGKTRQELAVAARYAAAGKKVLIVSKKQILGADFAKGTISGSFKDDGATMGVGITLNDGSKAIAPGEIHATTYDRLRSMLGRVDQNTVVIFDEAHALKNAESAQAGYGKDLARAAHAVLYATATPIDKPEQLGYLFRARIFGRGSPADTFYKLGMEQREMRVGGGRTVRKWVISSRIGRAECYKRLSSLFGAMSADGLMLKREISMRGVSVEMNKVELGEEGHAVMEEIERRYPFDDGLGKALRLMHQRRQQEPYKIEAAVKIAKREIAEGRQVVVFCARVNKSTVKGGDPEGEDAITSEGTINSLRLALEKEGIPDIAEIHGGAKKGIAEAQRDFQAGKKRVVLATVESGGTGINLDDRSGTAPRTLLMLTAPFSGMDNVQAAGRVWRLPTKSLPRITYLMADTAVDDWNSELVRHKLKTLGAAVAGETKTLEKAVSDDDNDEWDVDQEQTGSDWPSLVGTPRPQAERSEPPAAKAETKPAAPPPAALKPAAPPPAAPKPDPAGAIQPKKVETRIGTRYVHSFPPSSAFWDYRKRNGNRLPEGVTIRKDDRSGLWNVSIWGGSADEVQRIYGDLRTRYARRTSNNALVERFALAFSRRGWVERYAKQLAFDWDEDKHPRDDSGKFAEKPGGGEKAADDEKPAKEKPAEEEKPAGPTADEQAKYTSYLETMRLGKLEPQPIGAWLDYYRQHQARIKARQQAAQAAEKPAEAKPINATPEELARYAGHVETMKAGKLQPMALDAWLDYYRQHQARKLAAAPPPPPVTPEQARKALDVASGQADRRAAAQAAEAGPATPKPAETPRQQAAKLFADQLKSDYAFARASAVPNSGADLTGSARHKANAWRGLDDAEANGTAAELVTRQNLLKNEPHNLVTHAERNPLTALVMYYTLRNLPPKPGYGKTPKSAEEQVKNRRQYLDAYRRIKAEAEQQAAGQEDPVQAVKHMQSFIAGLIREYRGQSGHDAMARQAATDKYNETANALTSSYNAVQTGYKAGAVVKQMQAFAQMFRTKYSDISPDEKHDRLVEHAADIIEGQSLNASFGNETSKGKDRFKLSDIYFREAKRTGGPQAPEHWEDAERRLRGPMGVLGLQHGNYVPDNERRHHLVKCAAAFIDLADVLDIPEEYISWKGTLGVAFGARGSGNAAAHYEPSKRIINLTRASGAGSLAHEWGHMLDNVLAEPRPEGMVSMRTGKPSVAFMTEAPDVIYTWENGQKKKVDRSAEPLYKAFADVRTAMYQSGFSQRLTNELYAAKKQGGIGDERLKYFKDKKEMFARCFERYVARKLEKAGRQNTYLAGAKHEAWTQAGMAFWPTDEETDAMAPAFDAIFDELRDGIKKGRYWLRESGGRVTFERRRTAPGLVEQFARAFAARRLAERFDREFGRRRLVERFALAFAARGIAPPARVRYSWSEGDHPRGQPDNPGEFASKGEKMEGHLDPSKKYERHELDRETDERLADLAGKTAIPRVQRLVAAILRERHPKPETAGDQQKRRAAEADLQQQREANARNIQAIEHEQRRLREASPAIHTKAVAANMFSERTPTQVRRYVDAALSWNTHDPAGAAIAHAVQSLGAAGVTLQQKGKNNSWYGTLADGRTVRVGDHVGFDPHDLDLIFDNDRPPTRQAVQQEIDDAIASI